LEYNLLFRWFVGLNCILQGCSAIQRPEALNPTRVSRVALADIDGAGYSGQLVAVVRNSRLPHGTASVLYSGSPLCRICA
jgi:hypothetical protein